MFFFREFFREFLRERVGDGVGIFRKSDLRFGNDFVVLRNDSGF